MVQSGVGSIWGASLIRGSPPTRWDGLENDPRAHRDGFRYLVYAYQRPARPSQPCPARQRRPARPVGAPSNERSQSWITLPSHRARRPLHIPCARRPLHSRCTPCMRSVPQTAQSGPSCRVLGRGRAPARSRRDPMHGAAAFPCQYAVLGPPSVISSGGSERESWSGGRGARSGPWPVSFGLDRPPQPAPAAARARPAAGGKPHGPTGV